MIKIIKQTDSASTVWCIYNLLDDFWKLLDIDGLGNDFVDFILPGLLYEVLLQVPRAGKYQWLGHPVLPVELADLLRSLVPVQDRHTYVRYYKTVDVLVVDIGVL